jgi:hypothetical protein
MYLAKSMFADFTELQLISEDFISRIATYFTRKTKIIIINPSELNSIFLRILLRYINALYQVFFFENSPINTGK